MQQQEAEQPAVLAAAAYRTKGAQDHLLLLRA